MFYEPDYIGFIVLLSCLETGIGCIAASLPSMRRFYIQARGLHTESSAFDSSPRAKSLITIGGGGGGGGGGNAGRGSNRVFSNPTDRGTTTTFINGGAGDWERLYDEDTKRGSENRQKGEIRAECTFTVELDTIHASTAADAV